jgi:hypothetical protein
MPDRIWQHRYRPRLCHHKPFRLAIAKHHHLIAQFLQPLHKSRDILQPMPLPIPQRIFNDQPLHLLSSEQIRISTSIFFLAASPICFLAFGFRFKNFKIKN